MFYNFDQNNSGGGFDFDGERGLSHYVIIEAETAEEANDRAERIGIYFDEGYEIDCECCGTRWSPAWGGGATERPEVYGKPAETFKASMRWMGENPEGFVHYADGRIEAFQG